MNSPFCLWLSNIEDTLWRMVRGVFHFAFLRLPEWVYRTLLDTVGPATIRLIRVFAVFSLWLAVVFGPVVVAGKLGVPFWGWGAAAWLTLAISGSIWGGYCLTRRRRAAASAIAAEDDHPHLDGRSSRRERVARA